MKLAISDRELLHDVLRPALAYSLTIGLALIAAYLLVR